MNKDDGTGRELPALPPQDPGAMGGIRWQPWERLPVATHIPQECDACAHPGPRAMCWGLTWYRPPLRRRITRPSRIAEGQRPQGVPFKQEPFWKKTHWAVRCPDCDEMTVYRQRTATSDLTEIFYSPPRTR